MNTDQLFAVIVYVALGLVAFVVIVGGIMCVSDESYTFAEYMSDVGGIYRLLFAAIASALIHIMLPWVRGLLAGHHGSSDGL